VDAPARQKHVPQRLL